MAKFSRQVYHSRRFALYFLLAIVTGAPACTAVFYPGSFLDELLPISFALAIISVLAASVHNNLEETCSVQHDCGADHKIED